MAYKIASFITK